LDRAVFGAIESIFRRRFEEQCRQPPTAIHSGWAIHEDAFGPDADAADADWEDSKTLRVLLFHLSSGDRTRIERTLSWVEEDSED
jgi:hypothetical protein